MFEFATAPGLEDYAADLRAEGYHAVGWMVVAVEDMGRGAG